jgi:hypothetical protein
LYVLVSVVKSVWEFALLVRPLLGILLSRH